jgi:hypothetical protein
MRSSIYLLAPFLLSVFELIAAGLGRESRTRALGGSLAAGSPARSSSRGSVVRLSGWMRARGLRCSCRGGQSETLLVVLRGRRGSGARARRASAAVAQPLVLVNHVGYDVAGPKRAVVQGR